MKDVVVQCKMSFEKEIFSKVKSGVKAGLRFSFYHEKNPHASLPSEFISVKKNSPDEFQYIVEVLICDYERLNVDFKKGDILVFYGGSTILAKGEIL